MVSVFRGRGILVYLTPLVFIVVTSPPNPLSFTKSLRRGGRYRKRGEAPLKLPISSIFFERRGGPSFRKDYSPWWGWG